MADSASELESDTSSIDGSFFTKMPSAAQIEQMAKRLESLQQENRVLKVELETFKLKCKQLQEENKDLRLASVTIVSDIILYKKIMYFPDNYMHVCLISHFTIFWVIIHKIRTRFLALHTIVILLPI